MSGVADLGQRRPTNVNNVNWNYLFEPSQWYITIEKLEQNYLSLIVSFLACFVAYAIFLFTKYKGTQSPKWTKLKIPKGFISDSLFVKLWGLSYIPLAFSSWLIWLHFEGEWSRDLTVYSSHLAVNALFGISCWIVKDLSLALLNLIILIGVAMFTTTQFSNTLYFASFINTPYLVFLTLYTIQFCYFWYLNEGKEVLDMTQGKTGEKEKKKVSTIPNEIKKELRKKNLTERAKEEKKLKKTKQE
jgi:tryptophan-rich sensory protein